MASAYDVLVVGCGPAGLSAAQAASRAGASVCVVDGRQEIGNPVVCAELVGRELGDVLDHPLPEACVAARPSIGRVIGPGGCEVILRGGLARSLGSTVLHREVFDQHLARLAARDGAHILLKTESRGLLFKAGRVAGARLSSMGRDLDVNAKVVIGADGFRSQVGRWSGIAPTPDQRQVMLGFQYTMAGCGMDEDAFHFYLGEEAAPGGLAWAVPKGDGVYNIGVLVPMGRSRCTPKDILDRFVASKAGLRGGNPIRRTAGARLAAPPLERPGAPGVLLCGECACRSEGMLGFGAANACSSGAMAGEAAGRAAAQEGPGDGCVEGYVEGFKARFSEKARSRLSLVQAILGLDDRDIVELCNCFKGRELCEVPAPEELGQLARRLPGLGASFARLII